MFIKIDCLGDQSKHRQQEESLRRKWMVKWHIVKV